MIWIWIMQKPDSQHPQQQEESAAEATTTPRPKTIAVPPDNSFNELADFKQFVLPVHVPAGEHLHVTLGGNPKALNDFGLGLGSRV